MIRFQAITVKIESRSQVSGVRIRPEHAHLVFTSVFWLLTPEFLLMIWEVISDHER